ncbi:hypothetical protein A3Q56_00487 [Intoshia linei]|uniref:Uncharacterized protein n=1 Tax=Intoshia linei TaxID=1819745 RepID=A0A177BBN1_9BILA|nr:hypothetical protein A3Q56_00487 [Intoshia linei]
MISNQLADLLMCGICLNKVESPKSLVCLHSFCHDCLRNLFLHNKSIKKCPVCSHAIDITLEAHVEELPNDFKIEQIQDILNKSLTLEHYCDLCKFFPDQTLMATKLVKHESFSNTIFYNSGLFPNRKRKCSKSESDIHCKDAKDNKYAFVYCSQCEIYICIRCKDKYHDSLNHFTDHTIISIFSDKADIASRSKSLPVFDYCALHQMSNKFYCEKCRIKLCVVCYMLVHDHSNHTDHVIDICNSEKLEKRIDFFTYSISSNLEEFQSDFHSNMTNWVFQFDSLQIENVKSSIGKRCTTIHKDLCQIENRMTQFVENLAKKLYESHIHTQLSKMKKIITVNLLPTNKDQFHAILSNTENDVKSTSPSYSENSFNKIFVHSFFNQIKLYLNQQTRGFEGYQNLLLLHESIDTIYSSIHNSDINIDLETDNDVDCSKLVKTWKMDESLQFNEDYSVINCPQLNHLVNFSISDLAQSTYISSLEKTIGFIYQLHSNPNPTEPCKNKLAAEDVNLITNNFNNLNKGKLKRKCNKLKSVFSPKKKVTDIMMSLSPKPISFKTNISTNFEETISSLKLRESDKNNNRSFRYIGFFDIKYSHFQHFDVRQTEGSIKKKLTYLTATGDSSMFVGREKYQIFESDCKFKCDDDIFKNITSLSLVCINVRNFVWKEKIFLVIDANSGLTYRIIFETENFKKELFTYRHTSAYFAFDLCLDVDASHVYITDYENNSLMKYDMDGNVIFSKKSFNSGTQTVSLKRPTFVTTDYSNNVYISDTGNSSIKVIGADGNLKTIIGKHILRMPLGIEILQLSKNTMQKSNQIGLFQPEIFIFTVDNILKTVFVFNICGNVLKKIDMSFKIESPIDLSVDMKLKKLYILQSSLSDVLTSLCQQLMQENVDDKSQRCPKVRPKISFWDIIFE